MQEKIDSKFQEDAGLLFNNLPVTTAVLRHDAVDTIYDPHQACLCT
jgi:hypothetical protein